MKSRKQKKAIVCWQ